jgi:hexosaminidase
VTRASTRSRGLAVLACFIAQLAHAGAEHRHLLPAPRELHYGSGVLLLEGVGIRLDANADEDDRFSATTLAGCLEQVAQVHAIASVQPAGRTIALHRTGASDPLPTPGETIGPQSREAYTIHIDANGAEIRARSSAGVYDGVQTFCQMIEPGATPSLPTADVKDWPAMAYRGTMVDFSEGQLLRLPEVERQIDLMAQLKMNQYYLYNELTIAIDGLPPAAPGARMSKSDVRAIISYARKRHIDVVPCLELYGHLHDLFRREEYSDLADFPHGVEFDPANPRVATLLQKWSAEYMDLFPSAFVHIGFDETWQLQQAAAHGTASPAAYFAEQLRNVSALFEARDKTVLAWGDIMVRFPDIVPQLPPRLIAIAWYYDPRPDPAYHKWIDPLAARHQPFMVAPGVHAWSEVAPDFALTFDNIDTMLAAGRNSGALGMLNTIWSDDVQALKRPMLPGIAYGAVAAWQQTPVEHAQFFADYAALAYPHGAADKIAAALTALAESETALENVVGQETMAALWHNPFAPTLLAAAQAHGADLRTCRLKAEAAEEELLSVAEAGVGADELQGLLVESRMLDYTALRYQYAVEMVAAWKHLGSHPARAQLDNDFDNIVVSQQHGKLPDLMEGISELKPQYEKAWLAEFTSYRLGAALGRWDAEYEFWRRLQARLLDVIETYEPGRELPSWSSLLPAN